jgi:glucosylglycerate hydrolase
MKLVKSAACDETTIYRSHPFLVKDILFSAILVAANKALLEISRLVGASLDDAQLISNWISRGRRGLESRWDPELRLYLDYDLRAAKPLKSRTVAGFAPLVAGGLRPRRLSTVLETLRSPPLLVTRDCDGPFHRARAQRIPGSTLAATGGDRSGR